MAARPDAAPAAAKHELLITRTYDAPRKLVFAAWTAKEHLLRWWGPRDFTATEAEIDLRPGGAWRGSIRSPEGKDHVMSGIYREIVAPQRLVFTFAWEEDGKRGPETLVTVTFEEAGGGTRLNFHQAPFDSAENRDSHNEGWSEAFDRLGDFLAGSR